MIRTPLLYLRDIKEAITLIEKSTHNKTLEQFLENRDIQDANVRRLEIIGEATKNIPKDLLEQHDHIPWKKITGMRDVLTHQYFGTNMERIWEVIKNDIPPLKKVVSILIEECPK